MKPTKDDIKESRSDARCFREVVLNRAKGRCEICDDDMPFTLQVHHIEKASKGGDGLPANLIATCPNCHSIMESMQTSKGENPNFANWILSKFGEKIYDKLCKCSYGTE